MDFTQKWKRSEEDRIAFVDELRPHLWNVVIPAVASLVGGYLSGEGSRKAGEAKADAAQASVNLQRDIYKDQRTLFGPNYLTGGDATNILGNQYGIAPRDYEAAYRGDPSTTVGGSSYDWNAYYNDYLSDPNVPLAGNWEKNEKLRNMFGGDRTKFAQYHYDTFGKGEGRDLKTIGGGSYSPQPVGGATPAPLSNGLASPMDAFMKSPDAQLAVSGFRGVDIPEISNAFASGGKVFSGAKDVALDERGKARLGGAYNDYLNGLRSLAGMNQTASSQIGSAAGQYGANAGNAMMAGGAARGAAMQSGYNGLTQGISGAINSVFKNWPPQKTPYTDPAQSAYPGYY